MLPAQAAELQTLPGGRLSKWVRGLTVVLVVAALLANRGASAQDVVQDAGGPRRLALLVGIDDYKEGVPALRGCVEDVRRAQRLLVERMDYPEENIRVLLNGEATHEAIVRAFDEWLLRRATAETEVLFWFSGHGSSVPDLDGEREERDSTFLTADSRHAGMHGEFDLVDDELNSLLRALTQLTANVVVVTDSCHSGGGVRGDSVSMVRSVAAGDRALDRKRLDAFWPTDLELESGELDPSRYVHIAACGPRQLAFEHSYSDVDGALRRQGALSFFLLDTLERCEPGSTWRQVADEAAVRVSTRYPAQSVWYEGDLDRPAFGGGFAAAAKGFLARHLGRRVLLQAGQLHGLQRGSRLSVRRNLDGADGDPVGQVEVTRVEATSAAANWISGTPELELGTPLRAVVVGRPSASRPLRVYVPEAIDVALDEDFAVNSDHPETAQLLVSRSLLGILQLTDAGGHLVWEGDKPGDAEGAPELNAVLRKELLRQSLFELPQEPGGLQVDAHFESPTAAETARFGLSSASPTRLDKSARGEQRAMGGESGDSPTLAILVLRNSAELPLFCTVFSLPESRRYGETDQHAVEPIWPPLSRARDNRIDPGEEVRVPIGVVASKEWQLERPLRDRYLVIALPQWADFTEYITNTRGASQRDDLPAPLRSALARSASRGVQPAPVGGKPYGIRAVDLLVAPLRPESETEELPAQVPDSSTTVEQPQARGGPRVAPAATATDSRWHALLVGCDEYPELRAAFADRYEEEIRLTGPLNDVELMREVLSDALQVRDERFTILAGWPDDPAARPTLRNIDRALTKLGRAVEPGDDVLLYFSGHGSQQKDGTGDELDGLDEVFLPADVGAKADRHGVIPRALSDDRIGRAARRLRERGASVWLVFDCCHSGTMARGGEVVRGLEASLFGVDVPSRGGLAGSGPRALGSATEESSGLVALYASESFARTPELELPEAGGARHGLLTWALAEQLRGDLETRTFRQLFADVSKTYRDRDLSETTPMSEGDLDRLIGSRVEQAPRDGGALAPERLTVTLVGDASSAPLSSVRETLAQYPEQFELVDSAGAATLSARAGRLSIDAGDVVVWGVEPEDVLSSLATYQLMRAMQNSRAEQAGTPGPFRCRVECRRSSGGPVELLEDGASVHPGDRVRLKLTQVSEGLHDVFVLYVDARLGLVTLFPPRGASPRITGKLAREVELSDGWSTVTDVAQGDERLFVLAFAREPGDPLVELGAAAFQGETRGGTELPRHQVQEIRLRCEWPSLALPGWPRQGVVKLDGELPLDLASLPGATSSSRLGLQRLPGSRVFDLWLLGDEIAPRLALLDLDAELRERPSDDQLLETLNHSSLDIEMAIAIEPNAVSVLYDTDDDGHLDMTLVDFDRDGWAELCREGGAEYEVHVPSLSMSHLPHSLRSRADPAHWTSRFSIFGDKL